MRGDLTDRDQVTRNLFQRFNNDRSGAIAIIFALTLTFLVGIVGGAVDYANWTSAKRQTVQAMDAAVLAGGRALQLGATEAEAIQAAQQFYNQNKSDRLDVELVTFTIEKNGTEVVATSNSKVKTPLMGLVGVSELAVTDSARSVLDRVPSGGVTVPVRSVATLSGRSVSG
ncbi:MAG: Flp pilus assembly protein TadG [Hyphomicrobiaceae bacterium]|jgi:Flp pilus assembly protein TadG